jgi:hypothetical protein
LVDCSRAPSPYEPVTFTAHTQVVGACTTRICSPTVDSVLTACPEAPVSLIAGALIGEEPAGAIDTWKDGVAVGAGVQRKAHPMFQPAAVTVKAELVQLPCDWVGPRSNFAGSAVAEIVGVVDGSAATLVVVLEEDAPDVVDELPPAGPVVELAEIDPLDPVGGGGWYAAEFCDWEDDEPLSV